MSSPILVVGGSGRTGRHIVAKLCQHGLAVRIMTRFPATDGAHHAPDIEVAVGDITDARSVARAMQGVAGVIILVESAEQEQSSNSPRRVHFEGTQQVLAAANPQTPIVLVTQIYIIRPERAILRCARSSIGGGRRKRLYERAICPILLCALPVSCAN